MISVVACTNRIEFINNILTNFQKQTLKEKELIIILNSSSIHLDLAECKILQFSEEISLGECINQGASIAKYEVIAKMDDDDYYGSDYLKEAYLTLDQTDADVVGKSTFYIYFKKNHEIRLYNPHRENRWIASNRPYKTSYFMSGATLVFKKSVLAKVKFPDVSLGEDSGFQLRCFENGLKMYSSSKEHYAYLRYPKPLHHHSDVREPLLKRRSRFIANTALLEDFFYGHK